MKTPKRSTNTRNDDRASLRLWLRLLACTNLIESGVRGRLREDFSSTLPRFDMLAQLDAAARESPHGLSMSELSHRLMVTNGNVTGLTERLVKEGLVSRVVSKKDRRQQRIRLTMDGKRAITSMAAGHHVWINDWFEGLSKNDVAQLYELVGKLKESVQTSHRRTQ